MSRQVKVKAWDRSKGESRSLVEGKMRRHVTRRVMSQIVMIESRHRSVVPLRCPIMLALCDVTCPCILSLASRCVWPRVTSLADSSAFSFPPWLQDRRRVVRRTRRSALLSYVCSPAYALIAGKRRCS